MGTRWTPFAALVAVAAVVLAAAGVVAAATYEDDDDRPAVEAQADPGVTTTITLPPETTTTPTTAAPPETTTTSSPPTTTGRTTTSRRPTSTTAPRPTTTRPGTTTPPGGRQLCAAEQIEISGRPERLDYPAGQPVTLRTTIRNRSSAPCVYRGYTVTMTFLTLGGAPILSSSVVADDIEDRTFAPGQSISHSATWDPRNCSTPPCTPPAPGIYSTEAVWSFSGGRYSAAQDFVLR